MTNKRTFIFVIAVIASAVLGAAQSVSAQNLTFQQRLTGPSNSFFGHSVDVDGNVAVVGAGDATINGNQQQGAAYVYVRSGTTWTQQQRLFDSNGLTYDQFGIDVAVSGMTIVVSADRAEGPFSKRVGAAYVYVWNGTTWALQAKLLAPSGTPSDIFGQQIDIDGDTIVVGARGANRSKDGTTYTGEAYVFQRTGTSWSPAFTVPAANRQDFGVAAAVSGNTICVGATNDQADGPDHVGAAYIYERTGATWSLRQRLVAPDGAPLAEFGNACAVDGDTLVVGASRAASPAVRQGAAYVFSRNGGSWALQQKLTSTGGAANDRMGSSVAVLGDWIAAGAPNTGAPGSTYVFQRTGATWVQRQRIQPNQGSGGDLSGSAVALHPQSLFIGAARLSSVAIYGSGGSSPGTPPGVPRNFQAAADGNTLNMSWDHPSSGGAPTGYVLRARTTRGALIATAPVGLRTSFTVNVPNGVYVLTVQATNSHGAGQESSARTVTVPTAVPAPGNPTNLVVNVAGNAATFTWNAPSSGGPPTGYLLAAGASPSFTVPMATIPLPASPRSVSVAGIPPGTYYVKLVAQNGGGMSGPSNEVSLTVARAAAPGAPTFNAPTVSGSTVHLSWSPGGGGTATSYIIGAAASPGGAPFTTVRVSGTSITVPNVPRGTYYLRLVAISGAGMSPVSNEVILVVP